MLPQTQDNFMLISNLKKQFGKNVPKTRFFQNKKKSFNTISYLKKSCQENIFFSIIFPVSNSA